MCERGVQRPTESSKKVSKGRTLGREGGRGIFE